MEDRMSAAVDMITNLRRLACCECGTTFAMSESIYSERLSDGKQFYCPLGHSQHFTETDTTRLRNAEAENERLKKRIEWKDQELNNSRKRISSLGGQITKAKNVTKKIENRIAHGV